MLTQGSAEAITGSKDQQDKEDKILDAFKAWDKDSNGYITKDGHSTLSTAKGDCPEDRDGLTVNRNNFYQICSVDQLFS